MLSGVMVRGLEHLTTWNRAESPDHPLIIVANHSSWWDAVMPILISLYRLDHDAYGVMEERQLEQYGFFRKLGMFSVDRENPRSAYRSIEYGANLLRQTGRVLWLFPQGLILPNDKRPIHSYSGTAHLIRKTGACSIVPVAFRYELLHDERPTAFGRIGIPEYIPDTGKLDTEILNNEITERLTRTVDLLREDVLEERLESYEMIVRGRKSINERWSSLFNVKGKIQHSKVENTSADFKQAPPSSP